MIYKAKHHFIIYPFFKWYAKRKTGRVFTSAHILHNVQTKKAPVLLISNHISWWDGFWAMYLNLKLFNRKFHFMMLEEQLRKYWFLNYTGGFSINKKSRTIIESINYAGALLSKPENLVLLFPQGEIQSVYQQEIRFEKGIERIVKMAKRDIQLIFNANLIDYFSKPKPSVFMYATEYSKTDFSKQSIEKEYNLFYKSCLDKQKQNAF